jgi:hypothetical protein
VGKAVDVEVIVGEFVLGGVLAGLLGEQAVKKQFGNNIITKTRRFKRFQIIGSS